MEIPKNQPNIAEVFQGAREKLGQRLERLDNPYHNKQHVDEVRANLQDFLDHLNDPNLLTSREKEMLLECALRHDDGHSGKTYRQDVAEDNLSNEEYAVKLLEEDMRGQVNAADLKFMKDHILATSFGQANIDNLPEGKKDYYRDYQPVSDSQKLLALADVARFINGWDAWLDGNLRLYQESPQNCPAEIDAWIVSEEGFLKSYVLSSLKSMEHLFKPDYFNDLKQRLSDILVGLSALKDPANPDRVLYQERLNTIRGEK